jgi:hypothetical protein
MDAKYILRRTKQIRYNHYLPAEPVNARLEDEFGGRIVKCRISALVVEGLIKYAG